jgi:predicted RNA binding protein YcfA (HicA-like mRNA interferase family)
MKSISGKELSKILEKNGWNLARINGSHHIYIKENHTESISIPIHGNESLKIGLVKHMLKIAGIDENSI